MSDPSPQTTGGEQGSQQLNKLLGANTVQFHQEFPLPGLKPAVPHPTLPNVGAISSKGGTPNQKCERFANAIAYYHFVAPDAGKAAQAVQDTIGFFQGQLKTGHQCIDNADEALTVSHSPIWWRAIASLRVTTHALASRGGDYGTLESSVLDWIQYHTSLNRLGEISSGINAGKVLLPGARWKNPQTCATYTTTAGKGYPSDDGMTDEVNNVIYQLILTGKTPWNLPPGFTTLSQNAADLAGAVLAHQLVQFGVGFGQATTPRLPQLRSEMIAERYGNGHRAYFPNGMPNAAQPALDASTIYETGQLWMASEVGGCTLPPFSGSPQTTTVQAVS